MTAPWFAGATGEVNVDEIMLEAMRGVAPSWSELGITPEQTESFNVGAGLIFGFHPIPFVSFDHVFASLYVGHIQQAPPGERVIAEWDFAGYVLDGAPSLRSSVPAGQDDDPLACAMSTVSLVAAQLRRPLYVDRWRKRSGESQVWRLGEPHVEVGNVGYSLAQLRRREPDSTERIR